MGMVIVISLPLILFSLLLGFGCYFLGRAKGRQDLRTHAQVFGVPTPPPGSGVALAEASFPSPQHSHFKTADNLAMVWFQNWYKEGPPPWSRLVLVLWYCIAIVVLLQDFVVYCCEIGVWWGKFGLVWFGWVGVN